MTIQRYTKSNLGRLSKCDGGELVYYHQHDDEIREELEKQVNLSNTIDILNAEYESLSYRYCDLTDELEQKKQAINDYQDTITLVDLRNKKHKIIMLLSLVVNVGLIGYIVL